MGKIHLGQPFNGLRTSRPVWPAWPVWNYGESIEGMNLVGTSRKRIGLELVRNSPQESFLPDNMLLQQNCNFSEKAHVGSDRKYYLIRGWLFSIKKRVGGRLEWQRGYVRINTVFCFEWVNLLECVIVRKVASTIELELIKRWWKLFRW